MLIKGNYGKGVKRMTNYFDVDIIDLDGQKYDINSIRRYGNDHLVLIIKKEEEEYIADDDKCIQELIKKEL
jgi:hypothetical protein